MEGNENFREVRLMTKNENTENGEVTFTFSLKEMKKVKLALSACAGLMILSLGTAVYAAASMGSLKAENQLYQGQLKLAEEKMNALEEKANTVEKLTNQLQNMVKTNAQPPVMSTSQAAGGQGGASTVPDKAKKVSPKEHRQVEETHSIATPGELLKAMRQLDTRLDNQIKTMVTLRDQMMSQSLTISGDFFKTGSTTPDIWPVKGGMSSSYGFRESPGGIGSRYHEGIDIEADYGTPIMATANGVVTHAGWYDGYGYLVEIKHEGGIITRYGHNSALLVTEGQQVEQGTTIALAGSTGNSTGPHCHYEVRINGNAVDPTYFLPNNY